MKFWEISCNEDAMVGFVPDKSLSQNMVRANINPVAVRNVFDYAKQRPVDMQISRPLSDKRETNRQEIQDLLNWGWIKIFSKRATETAIELGCMDHDFWPCRFQTNPEEEFFFHLPINNFDIVDVANSVFRTFIPLTPPIPVFIEKLMVKEPLPNLPPLFKSQIPGTAVFFPELFSLENFKISWEKKGFRGAEFRPLTI